MHLDTVFTFADRDCVLLYPDIVNSIQAFSYRPADTPNGIELRKDDKPFVEVVAEALGLKQLRVVETGGNAYMCERTQWDSGANLVLRIAGRRLLLRPQCLHQHLAAPRRHRDHHHFGVRAGRGRGGRALYDLSDHPRSGRLLAPRRCRLLKELGLPYLRRCSQRPRGKGRQWLSRAATRV